MYNFDDKPLAAFLLPVYNAESSIEKTLYSVFNQDYQNFKLYIINNGSYDKTEKIIRKKSLSDSRIKIYNLSKPNLSKALCYGINVIEEEYILRIDAGDMFDSNRLRKTIKFMLNNPNCSISYTDWKLITGKEIVSNNLPSEIQNRNLLKKNVVSHGTICIRKSVLEKYNFNYSGIGKKNLYFGPSQDLLLLSLAKFVFNLKIEKIDNTFSQIDKEIKTSISYINRNKQRRIASKIFLINNLKTFNKEKNILCKKNILLLIFLNTFRLFRYKQSLKKFISMICYLLNNINSNFIYQEILKMD